MDETDACGRLEEDMGSGGRGVNFKCNSAIIIVCRGSVDWAGLAFTLQDRNKEDAAWGKGGRGMVRVTPACLLGF